MTRQEEDKLVDEAYQNLINSYLSTRHRKKVDIIGKAFNFARQAHKGVRRLSGEPYIMHPLAVAQIVCSEIGLGSTSICCALLHDVVEDTEYTVEDIENMFGPKIAQIVDGLTKIAGGIFGDQASVQAENFKKLLLTMSEDIRVILIKIADRLHNMRTLGSQAVHKQYKIAGETLYIYAPLAHRLGLNVIKTELEDLSFKYEHPDEYAAILKNLALTEDERNTVFDEFTAPIRKNLDEMGVSYEIKQRIKSPYSIWNKMQNKHKDFEEIYDILATRIIFDPKDSETELNECFDIYVMLSKIYKSHPDRLRDWVSRPKANGYQALHVTLMSNKGEWIEVQIRSRKMDEIAEKGLAAHWKYKEGDKSESAAEMELDKWLTTIKEILDDPQPDAIDFLDTIKLNLYANEIFVFTPKGDIHTLPVGATALDFAFSIHTFVGSHCIGAKVNHKLVPLTHKLQSGDQIEILTSQKSQITNSWLDIVTTAKAKSKIQAVMRREERDARFKGIMMTETFFKNNELSLSSANLEIICKHHGLPSVDALHTAVGKGDVMLGAEDLAHLRQQNESVSAWRRLFSFGSSKSSKKTNDTATVKTDIPVHNPKKTYIVNYQSQPYTNLCECCHPIPGDKIMGFVEDDNTVTIHRVQCSDAQSLKAQHGNRLLGAEWEVGPNDIFHVNLHMTGIDRIGLLNNVTEVISKLLNVNIHKLSVECNAGIFECDLCIYAHNIDEVKNLIDSLRKVHDVKEVVRL